MTDEHSSRRTSLRRDDDKVDHYADPKNAVYEVVRQLDLSCRTRFAGKPASYTCVSQRDRAHDPEERLGADYRLRIKRGDFLCPWCRLRLAMQRRVVLPDSRRSTATGAHDYHGTRLLLGHDDSAPEQPLGDADG